MTGREFEQEVPIVARALWNLAPGEGASELINNDEIDCVCRTEELVHLIECTTDRGMQKFRLQVSKLERAKRGLERKGETVKLWIVTRDDPTAMQRSSAREDGITALALEEFKRRLLNSQQYLEARWKYRFGSATDPEDGSSQLPDEEYVEQPLTHYESTKSYSIREICDLLYQGRTVVLLGPFGAGKSLTLREVFRYLRRNFYRDRTDQTPIAINLRDHWGQRRAEEVLRRHAEEVGFDQPNQLVRAWNAGQLIPLLDGFDELASPVMAMRKDAISQSRREALRVIVAFMQDVQGKSGILIAGRDHYFDSLEEARRLMRLPLDAIFIEVGEFSEEQTLEYLRKRQINQDLPSWLPRKPLLLGYLASQGLLEEVVSITDAGGAALAWDQFLDRICGREADLRAELDGDLVRHLLEDLATRVRVLSKGSGPLFESDLADAYKTVTGYEPLEAAQALLQRLPGLTARDQEAGGRSFVDDEMLQALQAGPVARFVQNPYTSFGVKGLAYPLSAFGCSVARHLSNQMGLREAQFRVAASEALHRWSEPTLALDSVLACASSWGDDVFDAQDLNISGGLADTVDMEDQPITGLTLSGCMVNHVRFEASRSSVKFVRCQIVRLEGFSSLPELSEVFDLCEVEEFDDRLTNAAIVRSELQDTLKVLLVIIRKLFLQRGRGRIESALPRGLNERLQVYVNPVRDLLVSEGIVFSHTTNRGTIWHGNRSFRARMLKILEHPTNPEEPLIEAVARIASV